jgi:hypothetical protein
MPTRIVSNTQMTSKVVNVASHAVKVVATVEGRKGVRNVSGTCQEPFINDTGRFCLNLERGRPKRAAIGGLIYHVLNRANARMTIFYKQDDYEAFERTLEEAVERTGTRLLSYCLMPNHWHLVVNPVQDGELSQFVGWLTLTHIAIVATSKEMHCGPVW